MTREEAIDILAESKRQNEVIVVDYPFGRELQRWSMKNFYIDRKWRSQT